MSTIVYKWSGKEEPSFYQEASESEVAVFFVVSEEEKMVRNALKACFSSQLIPDVTKEASALFHNIVTILQIFPLPVYGSPLRGQKQKNEKKKLYLFCLFFYCVVLLEESLGLQGLKMGPHDAGKNTHILLDSFEGEDLCYCL